MCVGQSLMVMHDAVGLLQAMRLLHCCCGSLDRGPFAVLLLLLLMARCSCLLLLLLLQAVHGVASAFNRHNQPNCISVLATTHRTEPCECLRSPTDRPCHPCTGHR